MNNTVLLNKLHIVNNHEQIDNDFNIYEFSTSEKYIKYGAKIIDDVFAAIKARSIVFESGKKFYVLYDKMEDVKPSLASVLRLEAFKSLSVQKISSNRIPDYLLTQLLLNTLNNYKNESLAFNNLTGKLFCMNLEWCKRKKVGKDNTTFIKQIVCLEIKIDKNNILNFPLTTFTTVAEKDRLAFKKKKIYDYPMYQLASSATLKRVDFSFSKENFIQKQYSNTKNVIKLIDFSNYEKFMQSKLGMLFNIIELAKQKLAKYLSFHFSETVNLTTVKETAQSANYKNSLIKKMLTTCKINLINKAVGSGSSIFAEQVLNRLRELENSKIEFCTEVSDGFNVLIINNREYYEGYENLEDLHNVSYGSTIVQHITFEDFNSNIPAAINCIIKEMIIKSDCINKTLTFVDWAQFNCNIILCTKAVDKFAFIEVDKTGSIMFNLMEKDIFSEDAYQSIINKYIDYENSVGSNVECVIKINESIIGIQKSNMITLPKFNIIGSVLAEEAKKETISEEELRTALNCVLESKVSEKIRADAEVLLSTGLKENFTKNEVVSLSKNRKLIKLICNNIFDTTGKRVKSYFRSNDIKYDLFSSNLNFNWFVEHGHTYYYVGEKNEGIQTEFTRASVVREICCLNDGNIDMGLISKLMTVDIIRNEQYTVVPFLAKYLQELIKMNV